ncbi:YgcG family protein [Pseudorhodobacter sp. W20_MBD10_FR17]|uniref:TPM domain-containing protein n=1 Tax=Pseudorhodobacter sp. W20_MBD10_FR17 TaxID=3240266 RepID=UPI003F97777D
MLRVLIVLLWLPFAGFAQTYPAPTSDLVNDYANLIPPEAASRITAALQAARDETGIHIVLATIERQADYGGTGRFADFATGWFNAWGIGDSTRNDGILILVGRQDREMRIALGRAYGPIWDGRAQRVIDSAMLPAFRNEDYAKGLEAGAMMAIDQLARPFATNQVVTDSSGFPDEPLLDQILAPLMFALACAGILFAAFRRKIDGFAVRFRKCPNCGARQLHLSHNITVQAGEATQGQGQRHLTCGNCGNDRSDSYVISSNAEARKASSSSNSRFGGGSSGGGGASGKW